jgi:tetratricopeptide (TPR) repeat protein
MERVDLRLGGACSLALVWLTLSANGADPSDDIDLIARPLLSRRTTSEEQIRRLRESVDAKLKSDPNDPATLFWSGVLLDRAGQPTEAAKLWERTLQHPTSSQRPSPRWVADAATLLGAWRLGRGEGEPAFLLARQAMDADPAKIEAYRLLVDAAFAQGRLERAEPILREQTTPLSSANSNVLWVRLHLMEDLGEWGPLEQLARERLATRPCCPAGLYYAGRLADRRKEGDRALVLFALAAVNAETGSDAALRSEDWLSRRAYERLAKPEDSVRDFLWVFEIAQRLEIGSRRGLPIDTSETPEALAAARTLPSTDRETTLLATHLLATLELYAGQPENAFQRWTRLAQDYPDFPPAWCRLAEFEEVSPDPAIRRQAKLSWEKGARLAPNHPLVRDRTRLGIEVEPTSAGVRIVRVERYSPAEEIGWNPGDTLVRVSGKPLPKLTPIEQLRLVRLFGGGPVEWEDPTGGQHREDISFLLLD